MSKQRSTPRTFFLNEKHELAPSEKSAWGRLPQYEGISWAARGAHISQSLRTVTERVEQSHDPLKDDRYFVLALPVPGVKKRLKDKRRAPEGIYEEQTVFGGAHGKVFDRLGLDLLQVTDDGRAVVHADQRWALGPWACGYNTLVCGAFVSQLSTSGLAKTLGWPSPFTRIGPGLCDAPVPSFSAEGGNTDNAYRIPPGLGVWGFSASGLPEDHAGSSYAAPILAREAALTLHELQRFCAPGTQPFAVTARAFLTLTADRPVADQAVRTLVERTLGCGKATLQRLVTPAAGSAVILWQGYVESPRDTVRVQLPVPLDWLREAEKPILRLIVCSDPPVNEVAQGSWACRRVRPILHLGPEALSVRAPTGSHPTYPVIDRRYSLDRYKPGHDRPAVGDQWLLEISYEEIAPYPPATDFDPRQRVAFAAELSDLGESPIDPQPAMQALPIAATMTRLSIQPIPIRSPIIVKTRV